MKTIGMIGGMSWESSLEYYRIVNETIKEELGGFHSAQCVLYSVNFEEVEKLQHQGDWESLTRLMIDAAQRVKKAGADFLIICTNTMHKMADEVQEATRIPLLHIVDVTAAAIRANGQAKVGLLGTKFTMEQDFYKGRLNQRHEIDVLIPDDKERQVIHDILYNELCLGAIKELSREKFKDIIQGLVGRGAQGVILGCTEIPLIVSQKDCEIPLYDTTTLHAKAAVAFALQ
ncbi:MAG: aspartate/glutamate racemase family protein [Candidatus Aminicenantes bacterium]|nr:aspartate/glutamate racemase family protein [Candidatus Aminicenantes bacterium]MDH5386015.1 aspartate/glutamate racemase family protein [Candidatus Aminicenantes bacterium]MDH5744269.1 aspartate/glutamate racemase family protein [Candidatus Aminicenantes bacterium]